MIPKASDVAKRIREADKKAFKLETEKIAKLLNDTKSFPVWAGELSLTMQRLLYNKGYVLRINNKYNGWNIEIISSIQEGE